MSIACFKMLPTNFTKTLGFATEPCLCRYILYFYNMVQQSICHCNKWKVEIEVLYCWISVSLLKQIPDTHYQTQMISMKMIRKERNDKSMRVSVVPTPETEPQPGPPPPAGSPAPHPPPWAAETPVCDAWPDGTWCAWVPCTCAVGWWCACRCDDFLAWSRRERPPWSSPKTCSTWRNAQHLKDIERSIIPCREIQGTDYLGSFRALTKTGETWECWFRRCVNISVQ